MSRTTALRLVLSSGVRRVGDALSPIKILLGDDPVLDRPDQERHVARQVREVVLAPVALLESLEMHERMVPGVNEEILAVALPVVRPVLRRAGCEHFRNRLQELKRDQIKPPLWI